MFSSRKISRIYFWSVITSSTARWRQSRQLRELPGRHQEEQGVHPAAEAGEQEAAPEGGRQSGCEYESIFVFLLDMIIAKKLK